MEYVIFTFVCIGMLVFAVSAAFMASAEKEERYNR
jgi:hypothetical protein